MILSTVLAATGWAARTSPPPAAAELLYRQGILPSGQPLRGEREGAEPVEGAAAACVNCHRRSGFGVEEGRIVIPPITGKYLFRAGSMDVVGMMGNATEAATPRRSRYTYESLARAIRTGIDPDGRPLDYLMPRFPLDEATMQLLIGYLRQLSSHPAPGATGDTLEFATIVTPDSDPVKRQGMLDVLEHFFGNKNASYRGEDPPLQSSRRIDFRVLRRWQLHVWELGGPPDTWEAQLQQRQHAAPVFAVISGIGGTTWEPIHRFCERESLPCLFPNVDVSVVEEKDFYPLYFSRGVRLEADLIARRVRDEHESNSPRLIQVYSQQDIGAQGAQALASAVAPLGLRPLAHVITSKVPTRELAAALRDSAASDVLVLWLRPEDLKALPAQAPASKTIFVSGLMGGLENAPLPLVWRSVARMTYPYELPALRAVRMNYPLGWFSIQHIPMVDERTQTDTYLACSILAEAATNMLDNFVPDYLIERVEVQLSHRLVNGYYSRLGLAPGQRFASKGGYLVRFAEPQGKRVVADGEWIVP